MHKYKRSEATPANVPQRPVNEVELPDFTMDDLEHHQRYMRAGARTQTDERAADAMEVRVGAAWDRLLASPFRRVLSTSATYVAEDLLAQFPRFIEPLPTTVAFSSLGLSKEAQALVLAELAHTGVFEFGRNADGDVGCWLVDQGADTASA